MWLREFFVSLQSCRELPWTTQCGLEPEAELGSCRSSSLWRSALLVLADRGLMGMLM